MADHLLCGSENHTKYQPISLSMVAGKTIEGAVQSSVEGAFGDELCVRLLFTDGTECCIVLETD